MDPILLARAQFAMTVMFHFVFPSISIGLGLVVAILEVARWRTGREVYARASAFWTRIFALTFVVGVATGIVMEFEFGTNWSRYSAFVGDVFGAPLAAEAILAFFLESTFLGLLLFGGRRIGSGLRALAACLVAAGAALSGLWIIIANSWMQTPAGYEIQGNRAVLVDPLAALFNPSTLPRYSHTIASSWALAGFIVLSVGAWYILRGRGGDVARLSLRVGLLVAIVGTGAVLLSGDQSARQVAATQEAKFAAMQGLYTTTEGAPLVIWSLPPSQDPAAAPQGPEVLVTRLLSFLAFGSFSSAVTGLEAFPPEDWPPVAATFLAYHNMADPRHAHGPLPGRRGLSRLAGPPGEVPPLADRRHAGVRAARTGDPAGLGDGRDRASALDRLWRDANRRGDVTRRQRPGDRLLDRPVRGDLRGDRSTVALSRRQSPA